MQVWEFVADCNNDASFHLNYDIEDLHYFENHFIGKPLSENWKAPAVELLYKRKRIRDFVSWSLSAPVISQTAKDALAPLVQAECEILPLLELRGTQYYAINVLNIIDCLDIQKSDVSWSSSEPKKSGALTSVFLMKIGFHRKLFCLKYLTTCIAFMLRAALSMLLLLTACVVRPSATLLKRTSFFGSRKTYKYRAGIAAMIHGDVAKRST